MTAPGVLAAANGTDDTDQLGRAVDQALAGDTPVETGPSGDDVAVVTILADKRGGHWRFANFTLPSNVRFKVDAGAVWQLPRTIADPTSVPSQVRAVMFTAGADKPGAAPVRNISIVPTGARRTPLKARFAQLGGQAAAHIDTGAMFTVNLDAARALASNYAVFLDAAAVAYLELGAHFYVMDAANGPHADRTPWPTSAIAGLLLRADKKSPLAGPFVQPAHVSIGDVACVDAPRGYGWNQINAGTDIAVGNVASIGGTALRLETDGSMKNHKGDADRGAALDGLVCESAVCVNGNRAVSLAPHAQHNGTVWIGSAHGVSCDQAVVANADLKLPKAARGSFASATVAEVIADGGPNAQLDDTTDLWRVGQSDSPVFVHPKVTWAPTIAEPVTSGTFARVAR